ncbi:MAG: SafA/ExsA family spore coat assembly protein [Ruminococcaceae bacterium]|nr:SafA/ExsA family spore coat assembly protein [Oscillospiraceae bacterium]
MMKTLKRSLVLILALCLMGAFTVNASAWDYTVKSGDSFWKISKQFGVDFEGLIKANPQFKNPNLIYPGQVITVPDSENAEYNGDAARAVLNSTNAYRAKNGLSSLSLDAELCSVAQAKAEDMAAKGYFSHTSPSYGSPAQMLKSFGISYRYMGENIAKGYPTAASVVDAWMTSEGHKANILGKSFTHLGVGYCSRGNIWVQIFVG